MPTITITHPSLFQSCQHCCAAQRHQKAAAPNVWYQKMEQTNKCGRNRRCWLCNRVAKETSFRCVLQRPPVQMAPQHDHDVTPMSLGKKQRCYRLTFAIFRIDQNHCGMGRVREATQPLWEAPPLSHMSKYKNITFHEAQRESCCARTGFSWKGANSF